MITLHITGTARPGGSKTGYYNGKRVIIVDACKSVGKWKKTVAKQAKAQYNGEVLDCPMSVEVRFMLPRPKGHYTKKGVLKKSARLYPIVVPDLTKLWRSTEDALTGIIWKDDSRIIDSKLSKRYTKYDVEPSVYISVSQK